MSCFAEKSLILQSQLKIEANDKRRERTAGTDDSQHHGKE